MIVVLGKMEVEEKDRDAFMQAASTMQHATRVEAGCFSYAFAQDVGDPLCFWLSECWESDAALGAHLQTPHIAAFRTQMGGLGIRSYVVKRYDVAGEQVLVSR